MFALGVALMDEKEFVKAALRAKRLLATRASQSGIDLKENDEHPSD